MIKITDSNGQALYLAAAAIAAVTETGVSSQWRGIRARVKLFDGTEIEASESAGQIAAAVEAQQAAQAAPEDAERWLDLLAEARAALWQPANAALCERLDAFIDAARAAQKGGA